ncbi:MAG TPA: sialidase family protein [Actinomycetota bacterium]|nr:sialidase family protein [Actinomycetota bacterium]
MIIKRHTTLPLIALVVLAALSLTLGVEAKSTARPTGGKAVAHRDGKAVKRGGRIPVAVTNSITYPALEPTLGLTPSGDIYVAAAKYRPYGFAAVPTTEIMHSADGGKTWTNTSPRIGPQNQSPITGDPYILVDDVDGDNSRIFSIDLYVACSYMSFSDDGGKSWITNPLACGRPVNDHQTLFSGPPVTSNTIGYPKVLYYCWNDVGSSACSKSLDGGITFVPTGEPAFLGYDQASEDKGFFGVDGFCGGLHGHGAVAPDGTVYLPREYCGQPHVAVSRDEGRTWDRVLVSKKIRSISQPDEGAAHPSVAVDSKGNVYYLWISSKNRLPYLSVSKNGGKTWSDPVIAGPPGLRETNLPQIAAGKPGAVAFSYYGSTNSPFQRCKRECAAGDYLKTTWNGYLTISDDALSRNPSFFTGTVNDPKEPLVIQRCGPGRCHMVMDFIDVEIGPDGMAYGVYVDSCMTDCITQNAGPTGEYEGLVSRLVGGPRLK